MLPPRYDHSLHYERKLKPFNKPSASGQFDFDPQNFVDSLPIEAYN